ncbi:MAG: hypothetical protein WAV38_22685 [Xanthobacteraceae bacterium]
MTVTRRPVLPGDERYKDAFDALREALGNGKAFEEAKAWAIQLCLSAEQLDWWDGPGLSDNKRYQRAWDSAAAAANKLAARLEKSEIDEAFMRILMAERDSGVQVISDNETCDVAFAKILRALAKQPNRIYFGRSKGFGYGPLILESGKGITGRNTLPSKSKSLAVAMTYGFRRITGGVESNGGFTGRFDMLVGGKPCYRAAMLFANATFKPHVKEADIDKWLDRHKRHAKVGLFWFSPWAETIDDEINP